MYKIYGYQLAKISMFLGLIMGTDVTVAQSPETTIEDITFYMGHEKPTPELALIEKYMAAFYSVNSEYLNAEPSNVQGSRAVLRAYHFLSDKPEVDVKIEAVKVAGCPAEWIFKPGANIKRRVLYLHGGAYVAGDPRDYARGMLSWLAASCDCAILAVDYRKAPEHPFPAALDDAVASYAYVIENGPDGAEPADRAFIAGDSAGGGLTLATAYQIRDKAMRLPDALVPIAAWSDVWWGKNGDALDEGVLKTGRTYAAMYIADDRFDNPLISPLYGDPAGLPPMLLQIGSVDFNLQDNIDYAEKAMAAGVDVRLEIWHHMPHVWQAFAPFLPDATEAIGAISLYLSKWD